MTWPNIFNLTEPAAAAFTLWASSASLLFAAFTGRYYQPRQITKKGW